MKWGVSDKILEGAPVSVGASATTVVSDPLYIHSPNQLVVDLDCHSIGLTTGITAKLQDSSDKENWNTKSTQGNVTITATAEVQTVTFDTKANMVSGDYVILTDTAGTTWAAYASKTGVAEVTTITAVADEAGSLDATYFVLQDTDGPVVFWIDVDDSGTTISGAASAAAAGGRSVEITTIATGDTAPTVAGKLITAIDADSKFTATGTGSDCVVTNVDIEALPNAADGDSGFTFVTNTQGSIYDVEPSGAIWLAADNTAPADLRSATTAAQVAAAFELAFDGMTGFTSVITSDDTAADGTMLMTSVIAGPAMGVGAVYAEDDSAVGNALAIATTTVPVGSAFFAIPLMIENSSDQAEMPLRPFVRVAIVTGAGDTLTVRGVKISHWGH